MKKSNKTIIEKMLKYCLEVEIFVKDYEYDSFISDIKMYRATTLTLMQIGELAYNLPIEFKSID